jgi:1,4-alpha-glucan branching enzyme
MVLKEASPHTGYIRVTFELPASLWAEKVFLVGDFNNWDPHTLPFQRMRSGVWRVTLDLPARRRYEFRYLIDGRWCTDYHADGCSENSLQSLNSFVATTLPLDSLATCTGHGMVHEEASDRATPIGIRC